MTKILKVTDPSKIVTDKLVLKRLAEQGIDKNYVEFWHDYAPRSLGKEYSPYAKFYRDLKSNKRIMVVSGLPMVKPDGTKIEIGWEKQGSKYQSKANLFSAIVDGKRVTVTCLSDQPSGTKKDEQVTWQPQLFLNNIEQTCGKASLLSTYHYQNVLECDYGICKRRIRITEGRIREKWVFDSNPNGVVRIKHNISGTLPLKLGSGRDSRTGVIQVQVDGDTEIIPVGEFGRDDIIYPIEIGASPETFYPDAHAESTSVDGWADIYDGGAAHTWAEVLADAGARAFHDHTSLYGCVFHNHTTTDRWGNLSRSIVLFDTSGLPDAAIITGVVLSAYGIVKLDDASCTPDSRVYSSNPDSNTTLIPADYTCLGSEALSQVLTYAAFTVGAYNDYTLIDVNSDAFATNEDGTYISKTGVTKLGIRNANYDVAETPPNWVSNVYSHQENESADHAGGHKPKLVVTYSVPTIVTPPTLALVLTENVAVVGMGVVPPTLALVLTENVAVVGMGVVPPTLALALTTYAPRLWLSIKKLRLHPYAYTTKERTVEL